MNGDLREIQQDDQLLNDLSAGRLPAGAGELAQLLHRWRGAVVDAETVQERLGHTMALSELSVLRHHLPCPWWRRPWTAVRRWVTGCGLNNK